MTSDHPVEVVRNRPDHVTELALELLSFDTTNPPGETTAIVNWVETYLSDLGLDAERVVEDPAKPNLVTSLAGERDETVLFLGHLDTVPFDARRWAHDPLGERDDGRIYGRGATDMKGPLAAMLAAIGAFAETDTTPPVGIDFAVVSDEEVAGDAGVPAMLDAGAIDADGCVIGETTAERGRHSVTVADRGSIWLTLEASGVSAHGSRPVLGENAIDRLYEAVETIREQFGRRRLTVPPAVEPIVEESIAYYAPTMGERTARDLFERPTINLGTIEGGEKINTVPAFARARLDIRLAPGVETPDVLADLRACVDHCDGVELTDVTWSVGTYEDVDGPLVNAVASAVSEVTGEKVYRRSATGGGDAKKVRNAGISTVEFALGTDTAHGVDEYTTVDALVANAEIYVRIPYLFSTR